MRVICSRGRYFEGKGTASAREVRSGVEIRRVRATSFGKRAHLGRLVDYLSFHVLATLAVLSSRWADVVVTLTTPPLIGFCGRLARMLHGTKHVNFVMDLHPDAEFECGMIDRSSVPGRVLSRVAGSILSKADKNVVLGRYQAKRVMGWGAREDSIAEIPVWSDGEEIAPVPHAENPVRTQMGWNERFVVMYSGNAGIVHMFDEVLDAADQLSKSDPDVQFVFIGGGPRKAEIEAGVRERELSNVSFHGYFEREDLRYSLSAADVHFMSLLPQHVGIAVPGKLYGILAAGRPVLFVGDTQSESAETIIAARAGSVFKVGEGTALADEIRALKKDSDRRAELGRNGREYFLATHERQVCVSAWNDLLESVAGVEPLLKNTDSTSGSKNTPDLDPGEVDEVPSPFAVKSALTGSPEAPAVTTTSEVR